MFLNTSHKAFIVINCEGFCVATAEQEVEMLKPAKSQGH